MTEKDNFTLDNPIMYDKKNGRCRCIPIPYEKDMTEKRFRVFKFPDVDKFGVSDDIVEVTVAFCDKKWEADYLCDLLNDLNEDNEQLKKRNNNQYNQLTELWQIIEEENWEKLIAMKKQLKEDEERLQQEWKCYE